MLGAAIIVFREVIKAGLIVGIVLAATEGVLGRLKYVAGGIAAGVFRRVASRDFRGHSFRMRSKAWGRRCSTPRFSRLAVVMLCLAQCLDGQARA